MARISRFTPIGEIPVVVLDTETTGLDVTSCRLVQISAVRVVGATVARDQTFDRLVNPGVPIPPQASAVHGVTDAMVATAPSFAAIRAELDRFTADAVLVGQSIGFDLAVLLRETHAAGLAWRQPQFLDTKLLAAALDGEARELGLDALAARLGVAIADRHHALADALVTAEIFVRLLPRLIEAGVRTLGDAEARCNAQLRIRARQDDQGWYDTTSLRPPDSFQSGQDAPALVQLDSFAYRYRVEHVLSGAPTVVSPSMRLTDAIALLVDGGQRALFAGDAASGRVDGIVTPGDVLTAIARGGPAALDAKLESLMSAPVVTVPHDAFIYQALARMRRLGIGQVAVEDASRRVVGTLSLRDLLQNDASRAAALGDSLSTAPTPRALAAVRAELPALVLQLIANEVPAGEIAAVLGAELRELLARTAVLAEKRMEAEGSRRPPVSYALLALGRVGRGESLLGAELEHALVFASGTPDGPEAAWFAALAAHVADVLRDAGVSVADGGVASAEPAWCRSLEGWGAAVTGWARRPETLPDGAVRFLDFRLAYGDQDLADDLRRLILDAAGGPTGLARALTPARRADGVAPASVPGGGAERRPAANGGTMDDPVLSGLARVEDAARALAVAARIPALSTAERLAEACSRTGLPRRTADELTEVHERLLAALLAQQGRDLAAGRPPSNRVDRTELDDAAGAALDAAIAHTERVGDVVRMALALV